MSVSGIDRQQVDTGFGKYGNAIQGIGSDARSRPNAKATLVVQQGLGEVGAFADVGEGDEPLQQALSVDQRELFDAVGVHELAGLFELDSWCASDQVFRGHELADQSTLAIGKAQVAVGQDSHQNTVFIADRETGHLAGGHEGEGLFDGIVRLEGDGMVNNAGLPALHPADFGGLDFGGKIFVNHPESALAGQSDGQFRGRDRIHGRGKHRDVQLEPGKQFRFRGREGGQDFTVVGDEQNVVEGEGFRDVQGILLIGTFHGFRIGGDGAWS
jgi:hypothetical protein